MNNTFGNILKELRRAKNISQRELAADVGVDFSYISKIENDKLPPPSAETIVKISTILEVQSELLLSISGKISSDIKNIVSSSPEVIRFLKEIKDLNLTSEEWQTLIDSLKEFR